MKRSLSVTTGEGSLNHNDRKFTAQNVDAERTKNNITYCNENIRTVYHKLFDEALEKYNAKQTRKDRIIKNYYKKISQESKQEKPFTEVIVQVGDKNTMGVETEYCELATKILDEYMQGFKERNSSLYVFSAHMHLDEATPHLHIDFVPFITGSKRGLETRVSLKGALEILGFNGGSRSDTELNQWRNSEKEVLAKIMLEHGVEWEDKGTHEKHKSVSEFKKQKLIEEVENLQEEKSEIEQKISTYKSAEDYARATAAKFEDEEYKIPEPPPLMSAKTYKTKFVEPLIKKLIGIIKTLARKCYTAEKETERVTKKMTELYQEKENLKSANWDLRMANSKMGVEVRNFKKIKDFLGIDKVQEILKNISKSKNRSDISK